ncbi:MAG: hypothetical protein AAF509_09370 [Pseudomonadota bacterium]
MPRRQRPGNKCWTYSCPRVSQIKDAADRAERLGRAPFKELFVEADGFVAVADGPSGSSRRAPVDRLLFAKAP